MRKITNLNLYITHALNLDQGTSYKGISKQIY